MLGNDRWPWCNEHLSIAAARLLQIAWFKAYFKKAFSRFRQSMNGCSGTRASPNHSIQLEHCEENTMVKLSGLVAATVITTAGIGLVGRPAFAAERILIPVGPLTVNLPVSDIESYVRTGQASGDFAQMISSLPPERSRQLKMVMGTRIPFSEKNLRRVLRSPMGDNLLGQLSDVMKPTSNTSISPNEAWQTALLRAAKTDGGFTLIDVIREYPANEVVFDVDAAQAKVESFQALRGRLGGILPGVGGGNNDNNIANNNNSGNSTSGNSSAGVTPNNNSDDNNNSGGLGLGNLSSLFSIAGEMQGLLQIFRPSGSGSGLGSLSGAIPGSLVNRRPDMLQILDSLMNLRQVIGR
jgi:hypothetical protein